MFYYPGVDETEKTEPWHVLLVEDSEGDILLIQEAIKEVGINVDLSVVMDGEQAIQYLYGRSNYAKAVKPSLILLDLNLPKIDGKQVLAIIKKDPQLRQIPVIVLTISQAEEDIFQCYDLYANCCITKPFDIEHFIRLFRLIKEFWFKTVKLPPKKDV